MIFNSSEAITFEVSASVTESISYRHCKSETFVCGGEICSENRISADRKLPSLVLSRYEVGIDEYQNCIIYVFHHPKAGHLQIFASSNYPDAYRTDKDRKSAEDFFCRSLDSINCKYSRISGSNWRNHLDGLFIKSGIDLQPQLFAIKLIDIFDESVKGDVDLTKVVDCNRLSLMVCKTLKDMEIMEGW